MIEQDELIRKFLDKSLSDHELVTFKEKWASDPAFVEDVRAGMTLKVLLKTSEEQTEESGTTIEPANRAQWSLKWAASILLALGVGLTIWLQSISTVHDLAKDYIVLYRLQATTTREAGDHEMDPASLLDRARVSYTNGDIREAVALLRQGWEENKADGRYLACLGDVYLAREQPDSALYYYQQVPLASRNDPYTQWNTAMAWLQKGELDRAMELLNEMEAPPSYDQRARELREAMNTPGFRLKRWLSR